MPAGDFLGSHHFQHARDPAQLHGADVIAVFGLIPAGVAIYAGVLWALKIEGREELAAIVAKIRKRKG